MQPSPYTARSGIWSQPTQLNHCRRKILQAFRRCRPNPVCGVRLLGYAQDQQAITTRTNPVDILNFLQASTRGTLGQTLAQSFQLDPKQADVVSRNLVDELSWAMERNTLSRGGVSELVELVGHGGHERYLDQNVDLAAPEVKQAGDQILSHILDTKHQSRGVAARVARKADVEPGIVERVLPVVAAMMLGGMEKQTGSKLQDLAQRFGGDGGGLAPQQPLPVPSDNVDYSGGRSGRAARSPFDDLSDMIRRGGGRSFPGGSGAGRGNVNGSILSQMVRQIFGNLLGFRSSGIVSWLIRLFVFRYGWRIVKAIFGRLFFSR